MPQIDPQNTPPGKVYSAMIRAITPRPIAWVSTISDDGTPNLAPFSYFNGICSKPAALMFSPVNRPDGTPKDTVRNIESNGQFVVNVVPFRLAKKMHQSSFEYGYGISEFEEVGLTAKPSQRVTPPGVAESPIQFECELMQTVRIGEGPMAANVVFGKILLIHVANEVVDENGKIDPELLDSVGRLGGFGYCRTRDRFELKFD